MSNNSTPAPRGLSLYANLLDPDSSAPGTISKGPVVFNKAGAEAAEEASVKKPIDSGTYSS
jgi:splicing factor 45